MIPWYVYAIGSTIFATAFAIGRKKALQNEHALEFESARSIAVLLLLLILLPFITPSYSLKTIGIVYIVSLAAVAGIVLMAKAFRHLQISLLYPLMNLKSLFVLVLAYIFLGESVSALNLVGIFILLITAYVLEADHHFSNLILPLKALFTSKYNIFAISALLIFSFTSLMDKYIVTNLLDPLSFMLLVWLFVAFNLNVIHGFLYGYNEVRVIFKQKGPFIFLVSFFSIGANLLALKALTLAFVSLVTPVLMLSTIFVVFIGGRFFKEKHVMYRVGVSFIMLMGVYLVIV